MLFYGSGFNNIYPKENTDLFYKILENDGLIISEYNLEAPPLRYHFLERNRIVAALSDGVLVIEAKENSGSITTAKNALELNKNLFVIPGAISNLNYTGSNNLLMCGGKCVLEYKDIVKEYKNLKIPRIEKNSVKEEPITQIPEEYRDIYKFLTKTPKTINQISLSLSIPISILSSKLTIMEMDGYIKSLPGKCFIICN